MASEDCWSKYKTDRFIGCVLSCLVALGLQWASADDSAREQLLQRLDAMSTFEADFQQRTIEVGGNDIQHQRGFFALKRPHRFLWRVDEPFEQTIVIEGQSVLIFDPDLEQLIQQQLDDFTEASLATLLTQTGDPLEPYTVEGSDDEFTLRPRMAQKFFEEMQLRFDGDSLTRIEVLDAFENRTEFNFYNTKLNSNLDDSVFELDVPEGTDIIIQEDQRDSTEI